MLSLHDYKRVGSFWDYIKQRKFCFENGKLIKLELYDSLPFKPNRLIEYLSVKSRSVIFPYPPNSDYLIKLTPSTSHKSLDISVFFKNYDFPKDRRNGVSCENVLTTSFMVESDVEINLSELKVYFDRDREDTIINNSIEDVFGEITNVEHNFPRVNMNSSGKIYYKVTTLSGGIDKRKAADYLNNEDKYIEIIRNKIEKYRIETTYILTLKSINIDYEYSSHDKVVETTVNISLKYYNINDFYSPDGPGFQITAEHFEQLNKI